MILIDRCEINGSKNQKNLHWGDFCIGLAHTKCKRVPIRLNKHEY